MSRSAAIGCLALAWLAASPAAAESVRWITVPGKGIVSFDADFTPSPFSGFGRHVEGTFDADPWDLSIGVTGELSTEVGSFTTGNEARDKEVLKTLSADKFPTITFVIQALDASFPSVSETSDVILTIQGRLSIAGVERVKRFAGRVRWKDRRLWVRGETRFKMSDFGIKPPTYLFIAVKDELGVGFDVLLEPKDGVVPPKPLKPGQPIIPPPPTSRPPAPHPAPGQ